MQNPPYFDGMEPTPKPLEDIVDARVLGAVPRFDHHRPHLAGRLDQGRSRRPGKYLIEHRCEPADFNQYGTRRGNHEVMMRGTFANIRIKNQMVPGVEGGFTDALSRRSSRCRSTTRRCNTRPSKRAAGRVRRQGIRHRLVARLGGEGHGPARRPRRDRASRSSASIAPTWSAWA